MGAVAGLLTLAVLVLTEPFLAIVWDEGFTLGREERVRSWLSGMVAPEAFAREWRPPFFELVQDDGPPPPGREPIPVPRRADVDSRADLLSPDVLAYFWPFAREEPHGHPPFYAVIGLIGDVLTPWRDDLGRARLGPMLLFAAVAGALAAFLDRRYGRWAALGGASAFVLQPRLFGHAHYAAYDAPLTALWVAAVLAFAMAAEEDGPEGRRRRNPRWPWVVGFGLIVGAAAATKVTGWFLPLPFLAWVALYRDRRGLLTLLVAAPLALLTAFALIPPWWHDPIDGFARFISSNRNRAESIPITTEFLGRIYKTPKDSLPWYNTLALTVAVTPVGFLAMAMVGAFGSALRPGKERFGVLVAGHWLFLLILRALPHVPGHDGVRLFLPAFGMLAVAAGIASGWAAGRLGRWGKAAVVAAVAEGVVSVAVMMPVPLSYYSPIIGGLPGADRLGLEPTYYWDALTNDALDWIDANTPPGSRIVTATYTTSFLYLQNSGRLRTAIAPSSLGPTAWYVVQNRTGNLRPIDYALIKLGKPAYVYRKFGTPLLWIFPHEQAAAYRASEASRQDPAR